MKMFDYERIPVQEMKEGCVYEVQPETNKKFIFYCRTNISSYHSVGTLLYTYRFKMFTKNFERTKHFFTQNWKLSYLCSYEQLTEDYPEYFI